MNITTKYNLKDEVFFMYDDKVKSAEIREIYVRALSDEDIRTRYIVNSYRNDIRDLTMEECDLYNSKEELLKSL